MPDRRNQGAWAVDIRTVLMLNIAALLVSTLPSHAGPCSRQIDEMQVQIDTNLNARAQAGPAAKETSGALEHRQPTPKSIAAAEVKLGEVSQKTVQAVGEAMARARKADLAGDLTGCEQALADAQRALGN
jgi:hypothetical protein